MASLLAVLGLQSTVCAATAPSVTAMENLKTLIKTKSCRGCDLSGLIFNRMDLAGVDLEGADLTMSKFYLANLAGANLQNCTLNGTIFGGADLGDADLRGADMRGVSLDNAYLGGTRLEGEFIATKPFEESGVDLEKEVFVTDQSTPKQTPGQSEVTVGERRDFSETPPAPPVSEEKKISTETVAANESPYLPTAADIPAETTRPDAPEAKKIIPVSAVVVEQESESELEEKTVTETTAETVAVVEEQPAEIKKQAQVVESEGTMIEQEQIVESVTEEAGLSEELSAVSASMQNMAVDKEKRDNLSRLLDTNRCYGCDLSGLDLSGKDLEDADLEKADLANCNLEGADLEDANLKGADLTGANLRNSDLEGTDFYNATLKGADLTGAKKKGTKFDGAILDGAKGWEGSSIFIEN